MKALPYLIAEVGLNHGGDYALAVRMIHEAAAAGANAVKFQYVKADLLVAKDAPTYFQQDGNPAATQHEFFARSDRLDRADYEHLAYECQRVGVDFLCTVFEVDAVHWIAPLVPAFKVASADITNLPLLDAVATTGKPVYLSCGASTDAEIRDAIDGRWMRPKVTLLHCVLAYPTPVEFANLGAIYRLCGAQGIGRMGYSDHTLFNLDVLTTAWLLGASVIEKHFTLDKMLPGNDHYHSMDPTDLRALVAKFQELQAMIGDGEKRVLPIEEPARQYARRGLYAKRDISHGQILTAEDIAILRPSARLGPERYAEVLGMPAEYSRLAGEPL